MKKTILTLAGLLGCLTMSAAPLTPEQALERLKSEKGLNKVSSINVARQLVYTATTAEEQPAVYVFGNGDGKGFIVLSADDTAAPLLGYSATGDFDESRMPDALRWWLDEYARVIEYANRHSAPVYSASAHPVADREAIAPMLKTRWDQIEPYNDLCPLANGNRTYTGCVATSIAQVMKYWDYPAVGQGSIAYNDSNLGKRLSMDFSKRPFDWDLMLNSYSGNYTAEQADAVAYLMRAAAFSVKMNFSDAASSAYALNIANGMVKYFNYDPNALYAVRGLYSATEWDELIYENLKNVGPVIYGGSSMMGGGHSFVCDGYDGNGYYHFNWGWSGMSDGYYLLDALNPSSLGSGGGTGGGYNFSQDAVLGIQPPTGAPAEQRLTEIVQGGSLAATIDGSVMTFKLVGEEGGTWLNYNPQTLTVSFGAIFEPQGSTGGETLAEPIDHKSVQLKAGYGTAEGFIPQIDLSEIALSDGVYKVTFATNIKETDEGWIAVRPYYGYYNYVMLTKDGDSYSVADNRLDTLHIVDGGFDTPLYFGCLAKVTVTIANDSDIELTRGLAPVLYYQPEETDEPTMYFLGSSELVTVAPHSTVERSWVTELNATVPVISMNHDAELHLTFFDESTYTFFNEDIYKSVTMMPNPGVPSIKLRAFKVSGATAKIEVINGARTQVWTVKDKLNIPVEFNATVNGTIPFYYQMLGCLLSSTVGEDGSVAIYAYNGEPVFLEPGESYQFSTSLAYPLMEPGELYYITSAFVYGSSFAPLGSSMIAIRLSEESGVDLVTSDSADDPDAPIYNLQGIDMGTDLSTLPAGLYIRDGKKIIKR